VFKILRNLSSVVRADIQAALDKDPAAHSMLEILLYPGFQALTIHRIAHSLFQVGVPFFPRFISYLTRFLTGIEIHPGARLGKGIFIDHGMGVVIGETAIVGDDALIYQGVTLGGTGKELGKRHPTLGKGVVVGAGAKVLGNIEIGDNVRIGAGSVVLRSVPSDCTVVGVPGRVVYQGGKRIDPLNHAESPDPLADVIRSLVERLDQVETELETLRSGKEPSALPPVRPVLLKSDKRTVASFLDDFSHGSGI
jgi:serine O-acetyltransferase